MMKSPKDLSTRPINSGKNTNNTLTNKNKKQTKFAFEIKVHSLHIAECRKPFYSSTRNEKKEEAKEEEAERQIDR